MYRDTSRSSWANKLHHIFQKGFVSSAFDFFGNYFGLGEGSNRGKSKPEILEDILEHIYSKKEHIYSERTPINDKNKNYHFEKRYRENKTNTKINNIRTPFL